MGAKFSKFTDTVSKRFCSPSGANETCSAPPEEKNETGHDPAVHGARLEDRNYNNEGFKRKPCPPEQQQKEVAAAVTVQTQYRQHSAKEEVNEIREEVAATKIQAGFRGYLDRETVRKMKTESGKKSRRSEAVSDERGSQDSQPAEKLEIVDIDLTDPEVEKAAMFIQSGFKGFKARKTTIVLPEPEWPDNIQPAVVRLHDREIDDAAIRIQSRYRGYRTRKGMKKGATPLKPKSDKSQPYTEEEKAAIKIQAGFRGHLVRKDTQELRDQQQHEASAQEGHEVTESQDETRDVTETSDEMPDLGDPDVEKAAVKIQAGFKGLKARKELRKQKEERDIETERSGLQEDFGEVDENRADTEEVYEAEKSSGEVMYGTERADAEGTDEVDSRADHAAVKIQAGFRGYKTRKSLKQPGGTSEHREDQLEEDGPSAGDVEHIHGKKRPDPDQAATRIQASFKGYKTRKELKSRTTVQQNVSNDEVDAGDQEDGADTQRSQGHVNMDDPEVQKAVVKIQAGFKGMKARQEVKAKIAEKKSLTQSQESGDFEEGQTEEEEQMQGSSFIEVSQDEVVENEEHRLFGGTLADSEDNEVQETEELAEDGPQGDETQRDETQGDETQRDETQGDETQGDETQGDETQGDETQGDETQGDDTTEQPEDESLTDEM
ncbi:unnamed protein product [Lymnaea stagnalis]|uniref:Uncharacterized protein n=1 Tax=Lymnaea stagnalis TaxID=6523 RepID=A0AAV2HUP9_LYMST